MIQSVAGGLAMAIHRYYGQHPNTPTDGVRAMKSGSTWVLVTPYGAYRRVPVRMPLNERPCRCTAPYCASGKVAPALLQQFRELDGHGRADRCTGENDTCPREIDWMRSEPGKKDGLCTKHSLVKATPAGVR